MIASTSSYKKEKCTLCRKPVSTSPKSNSATFRTSTKSLSETKLKSLWFVSKTFPCVLKSNLFSSQCEDQDSVPQIKYDFVDLAALIDLEKDATCDVLGIVKETGDVSEITAKASQKQIKKRELTIVDRSGYSCRLTLWGKSAETWNGEEGAVYAFKGAKVGDFGGRTLSMGGQSTVTADPDIPEAHSLRGWYVFLYSSSLSSSLPSPVCSH